MDPANYYITTFVNAFKNLAPYIAFLVGGYFIFIKMPFLFLKKSMDQQKKKLEDENKNLQLPEEKYTVDNYLEFQRKLKLMNGDKGSEQKKEQPKTEKKTEQKTERRQQERTQQREQQRTHQQRAEQKKEAPKRPSAPESQSPEEVFNFRPNENFSKSELKKRYFELLKQNHPDRVASMGHDFKKLAEKNTKEINKAYDKLKNKAS